MTGPSGTVTFLFTDIEGSTRRWEVDPVAMRSALDAHDRLMRSTITSYGGWVFKHTGDGICAAFSSARAAVDAAVEVQRCIGLPVRMGLATGEADEHEGDYFGPVMNRVARVMASGHGGQIVVAPSTAALVEGVELIALGEHRLRDLSEPMKLYQVRAQGLGEDFPPLRTINNVPGNLPVQLTSFVGRDVEVKELTQLMLAHRLVTLTGVGGVGKTRLASQVAAQLITEFPDGVWLVELAPVGEPSAIPEVVASVLAVTVQPGMNVVDSIAQALAGRKLLLVLDNCEHLLDGASDLVSALLARVATVKILATSREGLRAPAEQLWPVPSLDVGGGVFSEAVRLFVERAQAANPKFDLDDDLEGAAAVEICERLDGIALAIELAASRMVSMTAQDVRDRLDDRFRLLSKGGRGLGHHQTLRQTVQWSYDLLDDAERSILVNCSVFPGGFDLGAAAAVCDVDAPDSDMDEYAVLDLLDSLVRKSLVAADGSGGHTRYGILETIRQFCHDQVGSRQMIEVACERHAGYFAERATAQWAVWGGPRQRIAADWVDTEFANLRTAFRWAAGRGELDRAVAVAAHAAMMAFALQLSEPVGWAEELLEAATAADVRQLPRLYSAASLCLFNGRPAEAVSYATKAVELEKDGSYDAFEIGWSQFFEAIANLFIGQVDRYVEICSELMHEPGLAGAIGLCGSLHMLPAAGRADEAMAIADQTLAAAEAYGNPFVIAWALDGYGRAFTESNPDRALDALRRGLAYTREHRLAFWEANVARDAAGLEALYGELDEALEMFDTTIDGFHRSGHVAHGAAALANLAVFFERIHEPAIATTIYGASTKQGGTNMVLGLPELVEHLRHELGESSFTQLNDLGTAMGPAEAVNYARHQIQVARRRLRQTRSGNPETRPESKSPFDE